jgi:hypothetical protein
MLEESLLGDQYDVEVTKKENECRERKKLLGVH